MQRRLFALALALATLLLPTAARADSPFYGFGVGGVWYQDGQQCYIEVRDIGDVKLINQDGSRSKGVFNGPWKINAVDWNVTGVVTDGGNAIDWSNGTRWTRYYDKRSHIGGQWYHGGKSCEIQVYDNGTRFVATNELGWSARGKIDDPHNLRVPDWFVTGTVVQGGRWILWSNGTWWSRNPDLASPPPGASFP